MWEGLVEKVSIGVLYKRQKLKWCKFTTLEKVVIYYVRKEKDWNFNSKEWQEGLMDGGSKVKKEKSK